MDTKGSGIEYKSSDIGKKPKEELITNIQKTSKVKKFLSPDNIKIIIMSVVTAVVIGVLITTVVITLMRPDSSQNISAEDAEYNQIREEVDELTPTAENIFDVIHDLEARIAAAVESGDEAQAYRLKLAMADAYMNANLAQFAIDEIINPLIETNREDNSRLYDLYTRAYQAYQKLEDTETVKLYLGYIINLPDDVFPNTVNSTFKDYYKRELGRIQ